MPSSTFSSDLDNHAVTVERLKVAVKTAIAGLLLFGTVVLLFQLLINSLRGGEDRATSEIKYLPQLVAENREKKKTMVFGSSMVQAGFQPKIFDQFMTDQGIDSISYNYGMGNLNPKFQEILSRRIQEEFENSGQRLKLALIEFNPFQATTVRKTVTRFIDEQNIATLSTDRELLNIFLDDPTLGARLFTIRYLRAGISAELITSQLTFGTGVVQLNPVEGLKEAQRISGELEGQLTAGLRKDIPGYTGAPWSSEERGGRVDKTRLSDTTLAAMDAYVASRRHPAFMQRDLQRRIQTADIIELGFDQELIDAFIRIVKNFQTFSDQVEVLLLPRNTDWVTYSPDTQARLDAVLQTISERTGVKIRNHQVLPQIKPEHFIDTTHLSYYDGIDIYTRYLAEEYANYLR